MSSATIVDEPNPHNLIWWTNRHLWYDVAMNTIIIILITDAVLHMTLRAHKIPLDDNIEQSGAVYMLAAAYGLVTYINFASWMTKDEEWLLAIYIMGRIGHTLGFCIFLCLLYSISHLAMYIALLCFLWLVPAMFAPCCPCLWRGEPAWWNFVQKPQSTVAIV
ncbi:unnamed protein product [Eruca vesicaria subsp. sativa]|uniref:Uncharacterized protein n=1 Tax=Eruca vesicaria subsp. sativa TaxID=29727 RepID=A0ABC8JJC9_ERUVS|nr:unnamed protein product [Eruca vesicaria subsp. sativa]